jgi:hypothetical protein
VLLTSTLLLAACKKDSGKSVTELLMQKWTVVQITDTLYTDNAPPQINTYQGKGSDYWDFRTDGGLYANVNNVQDTSGYTYSEINLKLNARGYHYNILTITEQSMVLYDPRYTSNVVGYTAARVTLTR